MREVELYAPLIEGLRKMGWIAWRNNTGRRGGVRFGKVGSPDVWCVTPPLGMLWGIEVKRPGQKLTEEQQVCRKELIAMGGVYIVLEALEKLPEIVDQIMIPRIRWARRRMNGFSIHTN